MRGVAASLLASLVVGSGALADSPAALSLVRSDEARRIAILDRASLSTVCIFADRSKSGGGSGVIIDPDGYGLTNVHVVMSFLESRRGFGGLSDGNLYPLRVIGIDPGGDIAMFKLEGRPHFDAAPLGDSDRLYVGQSVAALGNPFILAEDFTPTITLGIISGLHRYQAGQGNALEYADCIQVSTSINPGNSGGPLFDLDGQLIGINGRASFEERGRVNVGLGYAVTINQVRRFLPGLRAGRMCEHGALGATVQLAGRDLIFDAVQDLSPADRAGVHLGDELLTFAGRRIRTPNEFNNALAILPANWPVTVTIRRDGVEHSGAARLERLPIRGTQPFLLDIAHNHAEIRRQFDRFERRSRGRPGDRVETIAWTAHFNSAGADAEPRALRITQRVGKSIKLFSATDSTEYPFVAEAPDADDQAESPISPTNKRLWFEWQQITAPLLDRPEIGMGWEMLGGDEVGSRVATVIERRLDKLRLRWKFDFESDVFLQATVESDDEPEAVVWTPAQFVEADSMKWPRLWRRSAGESSISIEIVDFKPEWKAGERSDSPERDR